MRPSFLMVSLSALIALSPTAFAEDSAPVEGNIIHCHAEPPTGAALAGFEILGDFFGEHENLKLKMAETEGSTDVTVKPAEGDCATGLGCQLAENLPVKFDYKGAALELRLNRGKVTRIDSPEIKGSEGPMTFAMQVSEIKPVVTGKSADGTDLRVEMTGLCYSVPLE